MRRTVQMTLLSFLAGSVAVAQEKTELMYKTEPGIRLAIEVEGSSEGHLLGNAPDLPGMLTIVSKEKRKIVAQATDESGGDTANYKMTGESTSEATFNGTPRDPVTETLGPVVVTFDLRGQVVATKLEPFEASSQNLLRFRWWRYIVQQLDLPPVLPEEAVAPGATWNSVANLAGPDGKPLKAREEFRFLGTSRESEGETAWLRSETVVPLELSFKTDEGEYKVSGKVRVDRLCAFDRDAGMPRGSTDRVLVDMTITVKPSDGDELRFQLFMHGQGKTTFKVKPAGTEEK